MYRHSPVSQNHMARGDDCIRHFTKEVTYCVWHLLCANCHAEWISALSYDHSHLTGEALDPQAVGVCSGERQLHQKSALSLMLPELAFSCCIKHNHRFSDLKQHTRFHGTGVWTAELPAQRLVVKLSAGLCSHLKA